MEALAVALLIPFIKKLIDFIRYARSRDWNGVVTQLLVWGAAVLGVVIAARTDFAENFAFNEDSLATVDLWSQVFIGVLLGSSASLTQDLFKSIDNRNTSAIPTLLPAPNAVAQDNEKPSATDKPTVG